MKTLRIGCCGTRTARKKYFESYTLVEVQHTFYEPPQLTTLQKWREEAPENFEFTIKAWQRITHLGSSPTYRRIRKPLTEDEAAGCGGFRPTDVVDEAMARTLKCAEALQADKILFQCPAAFKPVDENIENLNNFFRRPRPNHMRYLWEPRRKWPEALIKELCDDLDLIHVVNPFTDTPVTHGFYYYRIHGRRGKQEYSDSDLQELAEAVVPDEETYVLFNNVRMLQDAERFKRLFVTEADAAEFSR